MNEVDLSSHVGSQHPEPAKKVENTKKSIPEIFNCRKCTFEGDDMVMIDKHMEEVHGNKMKMGHENLDQMMEDLNCRLCEFEAETGDVLKKHIMNKHGSDIKTPVTNCSKESNIKPFPHSEDEVQMESKYICGQCSKTFDNSTSCTDQ